MTAERLDVRLDQERRRKLKELAAQRGVAISEVVRRLIDDAYEEIKRARRRKAASTIGQMRIEDVGDPEELSRELERMHEPGGLP